MNYNKMHYTELKETKNVFLFYSILYFTLGVFNGVAGFFIISSGMLDDLTLSAKVFITFTVIMTIKQFVDVSKDGWDEYKTIKENMKRRGLL